MPRVRGVCHADLLRVAGDLFAKGRECEAEALYREILKELETAHGSEHPCLIPILESLAGVMWYQVRNEEARDFADRAFHLMNLEPKN